MMDNHDLEKIYQKYYKELYLYAYSICKNHHIAQEIVSDTFFKALLSIQKTDGNMKYWLIRVCKNLLIDHFRKRKKFIDVPIEDIPLVFDEKNIAKLIKSENRTKLYQAVLKLSDSYREIVTMYYFMELTSEEIAKNVGSTVGSVRTVLYRARNQLRIILKEELK